MHFAQYFTEGEWFAILMVILLILCFVMVKYLNGGFNYDDEITHQYQMNYKLYSVIKRKYHSGRIKMITRKTNLK